MHKLINVVILILFISLNTNSCSFADSNTKSDSLNKNEVSQIEEPNKSIEEIIRNNDLTEENPSINKTKENDNKPQIKLFETNNRVLKIGKVGEDVYQLEYVLYQLQFKITPDFIFSSDTTNIVKEFQAQNNLEVDGIVGKNTFTALNNIIKEKNIILPSFKLSFTKEVPNNNWIIINKSNNTLYYLSKTELIKKYPVATGKKPEYTPEGKFHIVNKLINPAWGGAGYAKPVKGGAPNNPLGKRWMGLSINGGGTYGIHGNADESSVGTYASLGCIRMHNADVVELFEEIKLNTPVWIGTNESLEDLGVVLNIR